VRAGGVVQVVKCLPRGLAAGLPGHTLEQDHFIYAQNYSCTKNFWPGWARGMAQVVESAWQVQGPEFKAQYCKKKKELQINKKIMIAGQ
jgi:hypothetical protein